jgi:ATP-dependent protease ClpP protease subunit
MAVTETGMRARWAVLAADPERARQIRQREAERRRVAPPRPMALATAPKVAAAPASPAPADLMAMPAWLARGVRDAAGPARIDLLDEIGPWGVTAADFAAALAELPAGMDLDMHVSSPGGDVFDGLAIMNMLRQLAGQVTVVVDGLAASAASVIAQAASPGRLFMAPNSTMMIHDAWGATIGNEQDHRDGADVLGAQSANIADVYAQRAGRPAASMREAMQAETWYIGQEAVDAGLADAMLPGRGPAPEPGSWEAFAASLTASGGPGRPGNPALRAQVYNRWSAQTGRKQGRISPFVAAVFRP